MKGTIIQLLPNIGLVGGTAAKVRILAQQSDFRQVICYAYNPRKMELLVLIMVLGEVLVGKE